MPLRHEEILNCIARETATPLVDAANLICARSFDGIPGNDWYLDHVHPRIGGHQRLAQEIASRMERCGITKAGASWPSQERRRAYASHMEALPPGYFGDGRRRVEWLESWARREKLLEEARPKDAGAFVRAGFRRLELGDEDAAIDLLRKGIAAAPRLMDAVRTRADELEAEGRPGLAAKLRSAVRS